MNTRQRIILAVANGCRNTREISKKLNMAHGTISNYIYPQERTRDYAYVFKNGDILQWTPGLANTLRLADGILCHRNSAGRVVGVYGRIECKTANPLNDWLLRAVAGELLADIEEREPMLFPLTAAGLDKALDWVRIPF